MGYDDGKSVGTSLKFMRNYSRHLIDSQGRLVPLVTCIGNHDVAGAYNHKRTDAPFYFALHDGLYDERSYASLDFGDYLSLVLLDTGHVAQVGGEQADWLDRALAERTDRAHLIVANHVPAYPSAHTRASAVPQIANTGCRYLKSTTSISCSSITTTPLIARIRLRMDWLTRTDWCTWATGRGGNCSQPKHPSRVPIWRSPTRPTM